MKISKVATGIALLLLPGATVFAAEMDTYELPAVGVTAPRPADNVDTVIDVEKIKTGMDCTIPDVLRNVAGIQVQERANSGGNEDLTVKLRGHDSRHFAVLVDGVPVAQAGVMGGGYVNWDAIPLNTVARIEITKGAKSAMYGGTLGGVINIITKRDMKNNGEVRLMTGSNGRRQYALNYSGSDNGYFGFSLYANKTQEDAWLRNSDYRDEQIGFGLRWKLNDTDQLRFNLNHNDLKQGLVVANIPGTANYKGNHPTTPYTDGFASGKGTAGDGSYAEVRQNNYSLVWESLRNNGSDNLTYWKNNENRHEVQYNPAGSLLFDRINISDMSSGLSYQGRRQWNKTHWLGFGMDYKRLRYGYGWYNSNAINASALYPSQKVDTYGLYVDDTWTMDRRWKGNIGLRYDSMRGDREAEAATKVGSMRESSLSPKFNFSFRNNEMTTTSFSVHRIWRAPSMAEFYWHYSGFGNALGMSLRPEKGWGYEVSVDHKVGHKLQTKLTAYYQDMDSYINFTHTRPFNCYNIDGAKLWGFEWENTYQMDDASSIFLNYTNQHTKKEGTAAWDRAGLRDELDYRPQHVLSLGYFFQKNKWHIKYDMTLTSSQNATTGYPVTNPSVYKVTRLGGYAVHNLSVTRDLWQDGALNAAVHNLFDKNYSEVDGYPMEGRVYTITLSQRF